MSNFEIGLLGIWCRNVNKHEECNVAECNVAEKGRVNAEAERLEPRQILIYFSCTFCCHRFCNSGVFIKERCDVLSATHVL